jgi:iron complex outermembrane recepter protein
MCVLRLTASAVAALLMATSNVSVYAEEPGTSAVAADEGGLQEIVVTATRRAESAEKVGIAVQAFGPDQLQSLQIHNLDDLTSVAPGLMVTSNGGNVSSSVSLRGLSKLPIGSYEPAVVAYFADVPLPALGVKLPTYDLADVQVLKGPQGTLFGRNTVGGAVLSTPVAPSYEFSGYADLQVGNLGYYDIEGAINVPLIENKLAVRLAGQYRYRDGDVTNLSGGPNLDNIDDQSFRVSVLFEPIEGVSNTFILSNFHSPEKANGNIPTAYVGGILVGPLAAYGTQLQTAIAQQAQLGSRQEYVDNSYGNFSKRDNLNLINTTSVKISDAISIKNIFGYVRQDVLLSQSNDGLAGPYSPFVGPLGDFVLLKSNLIARHEYITDELQALGTSFNDKFKWVGGLLYSYDQPTGPEGTLNQAFDFTDGAQIAHTTQLEINTQYAAYLNGSLDLSDWILKGLSLNGGYRQSWDELRACGATQQLPYGPGHLTDGYLTDSQCFSNLADVIKASDAEPTYSVGLDWQATDDLLFYVKHRGSYRGVAPNFPVFMSNYTTGGPGCVAQGSGAAIRCPDLAPYQVTKPEKLTDVEVGIKSLWRAGDFRGVVNVAVYDSWLKGAVQEVNIIPSGVPTSAPDYPAAGIVAFNVANINIKGVEIEATTQLTRSLTVTVSGTHVVQEITALDLPSLGAGTGGLAFDSSSVNLPSPKNSGNLALNWVLPFRPLNSDLVANADIFATAKWEAQDSYTLPGYSVTNARIDLKNIAGTKLDVGIWSENVFNRLYDSGAAIIVPFFPFQSHFYAPPRTAGVEVRYQW